VPDAEQAIKEAIKQFEISDPEKQKRLVAQRESWWRRGRSECKVTKALSAIGVLSENLIRLGSRIVG
jgi:hypothetical protein